MPTPNLNIDHITGSQANKEVTANLAFDKLDNAQNALLVVPITGTSRTLTSAELRGSGVFRLIGSPASAFGLILPAGIRRILAVENQTGQSCLLQVASGGSDSQVLAAGSAGVFYSDGEDVAAIGAGGAASVPTSYDVGTFVAGTPLSSETIMRFVVPTGFTLPASFTGSRADARVPSTGVVRCTVYQNTTIIGAIEFSASGTGVFSGAGATFVPGDVLSVIADEYGDVETLQDLSITFKGTRT